MRSYHSLLAVIAVGFIVASCSPSQKLSTQDFIQSETSADSIVSQLPNYEDNLITISGSGRALVSEPGNSERVTINFEANRTLSLLTIKNRIGIEGGQLLVNQDSILIYNKIDKVAQKVSIYDGRLTSLNELASINIIDLFNFKVDAVNVDNIYENEASYRLQLINGSQIYITKNDHRVWKVVQSEHIKAPFSEINYEAYGELEGFILPRRITIFSADRTSKVAFLIRTLDINPQPLDLEMDIPNDIIIERL